MLSGLSRKQVTALGATGAAFALLLTGCSAGGAADDESALTIQVDGAESVVSRMNALVEAFHAENPEITVTVEPRPSGAQGDNLIKTRLSTGEMTDLFWYNSGSLLAALNPDRTLVDLSDAEWVSRVDDDAVSALSGDDGMYGVPVGQAMAGAVLYSKPVYAELGLEIPTTWDEFIENSQAIKDSGLDVAPVVQTYADTWTAQLFVLGDFANVLEQDPEWAEKYTAGEVKYAQEPALAGFEHLQQLNELGLLNKDFASARYDDGVRMVALGEGAQYPILSSAAQALLENYPDDVDDVGLFALPGDSSDANPLTVWQPGGVYIPKTTEGAKLDAAKQFVAWLASPESCEIQSESAAPQGPFVIDGCDLPGDVPALVTDIASYIDAGNTGLALEFLSPIKGTALEQIAVAVGSGITPASEGAMQYDDDVRKQAQQLGLDGW